MRKGDENSTGGFSIDDINLSESECPHNVWEIKNFERILTTADYDSSLLSPRLYSTDGYAYQVSIFLRETFFGVYFRLMSGNNDSALQWPCPWRQLTFIMLDKNPQIQQQMSKQINLITDPSSSESIQDISPWSIVTDVDLSIQPLTVISDICLPGNMFSVFPQLYLTTPIKWEEELD